MRVLYQFVETIIFGLFLTIFTTMKLYTIHSGMFKLDGGAMHGVVPKSMWNKVNPADENNMCSWAMRCLLIEEGNRLILIDTGMGNKQDEKFFGFFQPHGPYSLRTSLEQNGFTIDDITDVFLTHLHFDHSGGAIQRSGEQLVPTFRNATYWSHEAHWAAAIQPNAREKASFLKENILPIQESGQLKLLNVQSGDIFMPGFEIQLVQGHTESMMLPLITLEKYKLLFCADLIPSVAHISMPWVMAYDMKPLETLKEKEILLNKAVQENWALFFEHDPQTECATLIQTERGIKQEHLMALKDLG